MNAETTDQGQVQSAPADTTPLLELKGVNKSFPGVKALDDVSFDVREGEVHALLGENGAGKSTLIKILSGVYTPDSGTMYLDGKPVDFSTPFAAQKAGIATIYQELLLFPDLTVAENIFMGHAPRTAWGGIDWPALRKEAGDLLASLDSHDLDVSALVGSLSVGNRQRVEIAKALSHNARVLIMDEPTAALGPAETEQVRDLIKQLKKEGIGIFLISHEIRDVFDLADRIAVMKTARMVGTVHKDEVSVDEVLGMIIGGTLPHTANVAHAYGEARPRP